MENRVIKFRCWDGFRIHTKIPVGVSRSTDMNLLFTTYGAELGLTFMQFAGLMDSKGIEIYEGDIVISNAGAKDKVIFESGSFCWKGEPLNYEDGITLPTSEWATVIGNIYSNPELLK